MNAKLYALKKILFALLPSDYNKSVNKSIVDTIYANPNYFASMYKIRVFWIKLNSSICLATVTGLQIFNSLQTKRQLPLLCNKFAQSVVGHVMTLIQRDVN